ncbi:MAG: hypothetical protein JWR59_620 [Brevundimonas sp.]|nr:hypothetical protein [Brevundimonas sp.]
MTFQTTFTRGETFSLALEATDGDITGVICEADPALVVTLDTDLIPTSDPS